MQTNVSKYVIVAFALLNFVACTGTFEATQSLSGLGSQSAFPPPPVDPNPTPTISGFSTSNNTVIQGNGITLSWSTTGADRVTINDLEVNSSGNQTFVPLFTTTYRITAFYKAVTVSEIITITVTPGANGPPKLLTPTADHTAFQGQSVTLDGGAIGNGITYQWYRGTDSMQPIAGATGATHALTNLMAAQAGAYLVIAKNGFGEVQGTRNVTVHGPPAAVVDMKNYDINESDPFAFRTISLSGKGPLNYTWYFNDAPIISSVAFHLPIFSKESSVVEDAGQYKLRIENPAGFVEFSATVKVTRVPLTVTVKPPARSVSYCGDPIVLPVEATGYNVTYKYVFMPAGKAYRDYETSRPNLDFSYIGCTSGKLTITVSSGPQIFSYDVDLVRSYFKAIDGIPHLFPASGAAPIPVPSLDFATLRGVGKSGRDGAAFGDKSGCYFYSSARTRVTTPANCNGLALIQLTASSLASFFKDSAQVYGFFEYGGGTFQVITYSAPVVDAASFEAVGGSETYFKDIRKVFVLLRGDSTKPTSFGELVGADTATFKMISRDFAGDKTQVFYLGTILEGIDPLNHTLERQYIWSANTVYYNGTRITGLATTPAPTVIEVWSGSYIKDSLNVYFKATPVAGANAASFTAFSATHYYAKDDVSIFCEGKVLAGADYATFKSLLGINGEDAFATYYYCFRTPK